MNDFASFLKCFKHPIHAFAQCKTLLHPYPDIFLVSYEVLHLTYDFPAGSFLVEAEKVEHVCVPECSGPPLVSCDPKSLVVISSTLSSPGRLSVLCVCTTSSPDRPQTPWRTCTLSLRPRLLTNQARLLTVSAAPNVSFACV